MAITRDQTYTFGGTNYRAGRPIPEEVARKHGLIGEGRPSQEEGAAGESLSFDELPRSEALRAAGYESVEAVAAASDEALLGVDGIGPTTLEEIRALLGAADSDE